MKHRHNIVHQILGAGTCLLLAVLLAACGAHAGAPPKPTAVPATAMPTTAPASATPTVIRSIPTPTSTRSPQVSTSGVATAVPIPTSTPTSVPAVTSTAPPVSSGQIVFAALQPAPGSTSGRSVAITFTVQAPVPITAVHLSLDGKQVTPELGGRDERHLSALYQPPHWSAGQHSVLVSATAGAQTETRSWTFVIR